MISSPGFSADLPANAASPRELNANAPFTIPVSALPLGGAEAGGYRLPASETDEGILSRDREDTLISSVDIRAGRVLVGAGARGGVLNWAGVGVDVISGANVVQKMIRGVPIEETDKLVMGGYLEASFRDTDDKFTQLVAKLLQSKGLNFEAGMNVDVQFTGDGEGGLRLEKITVASILVLPQVGNSEGTYRNFAGPGGVHSWTFGKDGGVVHDAQAQMRQGTFGLANPTDDNQLRLDNIPGTRGLMYAMISRELDEPMDATIGLRQGLTYLNTPNANWARVGDIATATEFLVRLGNSVVGEPNLGPDGQPEVTTLRGWVRAVQALTPAQVATPAGVPMPGLFVEANGYIKVTEDGDPTLRFYSTASSEPFLEVSLEQLKTFYERTTDAVDNAIDRVLSFDFFRAETVNSPPPEQTQSATQRALAAAIAAQRAGNGTVAPPTSGLTVDPGVIEPGRATEIGGGAVFRDWYSPETLAQAQQLARNFNAQSNTTVALGYPALDTESGEWMSEVAVGAQINDGYTGITPSEARTLLGRLRDAGRLPDSWTNDQIFQASGIGAGSTPYADLVERDAGIYFNGLDDEQVLASAQRSWGQTDQSPAVYSSAEYNQILPQVMEANVVENGYVALAIPALTTIPYDSPEDRDSTPDFFQTYEITLVYSGLTPQQAVDAINEVLGSGQLAKPIEEVLRDNGLSEEGLQQRQDLFAP